MEKDFYVYIMASKKNGTLYIGVTSNLVKLIYQHKHHLVEGFTQKYKIHTLVFYEQHFSAESAIKREKRLKEWPRRWKLALIEETNPDWNDLYPVITGFRP